MSGPSKVIVLEPDPRAGRQVQLGFEREGVPTHVPTIPSDAAQLSDLASQVPGLVLIGGANGQAVDLVRRARELVGPEVPIVSTARGAARADLEAAGADEILARPSYLRDLVTICRILRGSPAGKRDHLVGSLVETTGVYTLVRALSSLGRSAVLTLIRGLRRGEVRFYRGEVTSAEVGLIHGQAALHQLLLWTDARFDFAHEDIVRRQQIPLTPDELFADAERFLEGVREHAGTLSPATVLEQDLQRIQYLGAQVPTEVHGVLRMFDGHRVLADILEDSPYRVFETLRVAQKAVEVGLLRPVDTQRPKATWRAVLAIDEWLVGTDTREAVVERTADLDSGPVSSTTAKRKGKGKSRKRTKPATPPAGIRAEIDWGALVPRTIGAEVGPLAGVVPSQATAGEVTIASRDREREKLEAMMDTDKRDRIFPKEIGIEPSIVVADDAAMSAKAIASSSEPETVAGKKKRKKKGDKSGPVGRVTPPPGELADAAAKVEADARAKADADARAKVDADARAKADAEARAKADAEARAKAEADARAKAEAEARAKAEADARAKAEADARAKAAEAAEQQARVAESVERMRLDRIAREEAEQKAREEAARAAAAEEARTYAARVKAAAEAKREEAERAAREQAIADAERAASDKANAEAERAAREQDVAAALAKDPAAAAMIAVPKSGPIKMPDAAAAVASADATASAPRERDPARTDARALVRDLVSEALPPSTNLAASEAAPPSTNLPAAPPSTNLAAAPPSTNLAASEAAPPSTNLAAAPPSTNLAASDAAPPSTNLAAPEVIVAPTTGQVVPEPSILTTPPAPTTEMSPIDSAAATRNDEDLATTAFVRPSLELDDDANAKPAPVEPAADPIRAHIAQPLNIIEAGHTRVAIADLVTVTTTDNTARVTSIPKVLISEEPSIAPVASTTPSQSASSGELGATKRPPSESDATPQETDDEPSDGVVRATIATASTARVAARARAARAPEPEHDGPIVKEATGEIRERTPRTDVPLRRSEPTILVADLASANAAAAQAAAATADDLAAAHKAIAAVATKPATPPPADAATPAREAEVNDIRRDAHGFDEHEEAFFNRAESGTNVVPKFESFDDLDEGYQPVGFWDRVFGRTKPKKK